MEAYEQYYRNNETRLKEHLEREKILTKSVWEVCKKHNLDEVANSIVERVVSRNEHFELWRPSLKQYKDNKGRVKYMDRLPRVTEGFEKENQGVRKLIDCVNEGQEFEEIRMYLKESDEQIVFKKSKIIKMILEFLDTDGIEKRWSFPLKLGLPRRGRPPSKEVKEFDRLVAELDPIIRIVLPTVSIYKCAEIIEDLLLESSFEQRSISDIDKKLRSL